MGCTQSDGQLQVYILNLHVDCCLFCIAEKSNTVTTIAATTGDQKVDDGCYEVGGNQQN